MNKKDLLMEIYTEELPPNAVKEFMVQLPSITKNVLDEFRVDYKSIETYITPVRIIIYISNVAEQTKKEVVEILGPSEKIGLKNGEFTIQAQGFAKKYNVDLKDLYIKETKKGRFLALKKVYGGQNIKELVKDVLPRIIQGLSYPKTMKWEEGKFRFPRPIRNLLVIYGNEIIKLKFVSLTSSNFVYGIKTYPIRKIKLSRSRKESLVDLYFQTLKNECILFDYEKRFETLTKSIENITTRKKLNYDKDLKLLNEIVSIVEYPSCILCEFPEEFLSLPHEFVITCMKAKQKFIPLYDENKKLVNFFIGVKNGSSENLAYVKDGFQKVLIARLEDVKYYYETDKKLDFISYFDKLKGVVYNTKLKCSYYDKVVRTRELAKLLNKKLGFNIPEDIIDITAKLIKNDLVTQIVFEYPELQGVAGMIYCSDYCEKNNLPKEVAECCEEHLKPKGFNDILPKNGLSILFSLSDKISTIIEQTLVDNLPTGKSDPLGLKDTADGIIKICVDLCYDLNLRELFEFYTKIVNFEFQQNMFNKFLSFFATRFENILLEKFKIDEIRTVISNFNGEFYTKSIILSSLKKFRQTEAFLKLVEMYKRIYNILQQAKNKFPQNVLSDKVNPELFTTEVETEFYNKVSQFKNETKKLVDEKNYDEFINKLVDLKPGIDIFFEKVLVFDQNIDIAKNRVLLLNMLLNIISELGVLYHIQV
jgi:glycyl-tRNA synthetase beta chain